MRSYQWRMAVALGIAVLPVAVGFRPLFRPAARGESVGNLAHHVMARSYAIRLPVQLDEQTRASLSEIRLFVKAAEPGCSQRQLWKRARRRRKADFDYRAEKDGEYAFLFVTVDKSGRSTPDSFEARPPHQIIVIDTTPPELTVQPLPVANRDIFLQCRMIDANPDPSSLKLEFLLADNVWQAMELVSADTPGVFRIPYSSVLEGKVRATGADKAGNTSVRIVDLGDPTRSFNVADTPKPPENLPPSVAKTDPPTVPASESASAPAKQSAPADAIGSIPDAQTVPPGNSPTSVPVVVELTIDAPPIANPKNPANPSIAPVAEDGSNTSKKVDPFFPPLGPAAAPPKTEAVAIKDQTNEPTNTAAGTREAVAKTEPAAPIAEITQVTQAAQVAHVEGIAPKNKQIAEIQSSPPAIPVHPMINTQRLRPSTTPWKTWSSAGRSTWNSGRRMTMPEAGSVCGMNRADARPPSWFCLATASSAFASKRTTMGSRLSRVKPPMPGLK